jgi:hypothetical protein
MEKTKTTTNANQSGISSITLLNNLRKNVESREQLGVLLVDHVLREAATGKHFREDGIAEIPLTITISMSQMATDSVSPIGIESDTQVCDSVCISSFGVSLYCYQRCHSVHAQ